MFHYNKNKMVARTFNICTLKAAGSTAALQHCKCKCVLQLPVVWSLIAVWLLPAEQQAGCCVSPP
jgi:hypothetical protein